MVIATQNPIELEGTYPLPEAQLDRFMLRLRIGYPDRDAELAILDVYGDARDRHRRARAGVRCRDRGDALERARADPHRTRAAGLRRRPLRRDSSSPRPHARRQPARLARAAARVAGAGGERRPAVRRTRRHQGARAVDARAPSRTRAGSDDARCRAPATCSRRCSRAFRYRPTVSPSERLPRC